MHLFVSFILKAIAVFIKDVVLYEVGEVDNCSSGSVSYLPTTLLLFAVGVLRLTTQGFLLLSLNPKEVQLCVKLSR